MSIARPHNGSPSLPANGDPYDWTATFENRTQHTSSVHGSWATFSSLKEIGGIWLYESNERLRSLQVTMLASGERTTLMTPINRPLPMFAFKQFRTSLSSSEPDGLPINEWRFTLFGYEFAGTRTFLIIRPDGIMLRSCPSHWDIDLGHISSLTF